jgi:hypothetical protein
VGSRQLRIGRVYLGQASEHLEILARPPSECGIFRRDDLGHIPMRPFIRSDPSPIRHGATYLLVPRVVSLKTSQGALSNVSNMEQTRMC